MAELAETMTLAREDASDVGPNASRDVLVRSWRPALRNAARDVRQFVATAETDFGAFGAALQDCLRRCRRVAGSGNADVSTFSVEAVQNLAARFETELRQFQATAANGDELAGRIEASIRLALRIVHGVSSFGGRLDQSAARLRFLGLSTRIESGQLEGRNGSYGSFADEVTRLGNEVALGARRTRDSTAILTDRLRASLQTLAHTRQSGQDGLAAAVQRFESGLCELTTARQQHAAQTRRLIERSTALEADISDIIYSCQFGDITRQRLEGVIAGLDAFEAHVGGDRGVTTLDSQLHAGAAIARLQRRQLIAADRDLRGAADDLRLRIGAVVDRIDALAADFASMDDGDDRRVGASLDRLYEEFSAVPALVAELAGSNQELTGALSAVLSMAADTSRVFDRIVAFGPMLGAMALNAVLMADRLGQRGKTLTAIANEMKAQCRADQDLTRKVLGEFRRLEEISGELSRQIQDYSELMERDLGQAVGRFETLIAELREQGGQDGPQLAWLAHEVIVLRQDLAAANEGLRIDSELQTLAGRVADGALLAVERDGDRLGIDDVEGVQDLLAELATAYTMESQRRIHRDVLGLDAPSPAMNEQVANDDEIEFF